MLNLFESGILLTFIFVILYIISKLYINKYNLTKDYHKNLAKFYMGLIYIVFGLIKLYDLRLGRDRYARNTYASRNGHVVHPKLS